MILANYEEKIENFNEIKLNDLDNFYYDKKNIIKCPYCNFMTFYINNNYCHFCPIKKEKFILNKNIFKNKDNQFLCDVNETENKCVEHEKEFFFYKDSNYYCSDCLSEKKLNDFVLLDEIVLSKDEINNFENLIKNYEDILVNIKLMNEKLIGELLESQENFVKRNKLLIDYCKGLIKYNNKYKKNYNLISTIRRISLDFNMNQFKKNINRDLIEFYNNFNIIKFNNNFSYNKYFSSEKILQNGKYYLNKLISKGGFGEMYEGLSIKDKKVVAIKKILSFNKEEIINEINLLKVMSNCENSVKYIESFQENNITYIVTELCESNLRKVIQNNENGLSINEIKKIFCQINEGIKYLLNRSCIHRDLKPDNILISEIKKNNKSYFKYKLCDYGASKNVGNTILITKIGTSLYIAPEIIEKNDYSFKSDIFSLGIILYELYYGNKDNKLTQKNILNNIKKGLQIKNENDDINEFNLFKNLIEECTKIEEKRIDWYYYFNHPFFYYEIEMILNIKKEDLNKNVKLIGLNNFNEENAELFINDEKELFTKDYIFNKKGIYTIKYKFNSFNFTSLEKFFYECKNIEYINFNIFNTSNIENSKGMFYDCFNLKELDLNIFNTLNIKDMSHMFSGCHNLKKIDISSFETSKVLNMESMFYDCSNLEEINLTSFKTFNVKDMNYMFSRCQNLKEIDLSSFTTSNVININNMFSECYNLREIIFDFDTKNVENMKNLFSNCYNLKEINLSSFNTSNVKNMSCLFSGCHNLKEIDLRLFKTSKVEYMNNMFSNCYNLREIDLLRFDTSNVKEMNHMFFYCYNLKKINLNSFKTFNVEDMNNMFSGCCNINEINLNSFDSSKVENMESMFYNCSNLIKINLSSFCTKNVKNMENMFKNCSNLNEIDLTMFDISNVKNIKNIFEHCSNLQTIKVDELFKNDFYNIVNNKNINII